MKSWSHGEHGFHKDIEKNVLKENHLLRNGKQNLWIISRKHP